MGSSPLIFTLLLCLITVQGKVKSDAGDLKKDAPVKAKLNSDFKRLVKEREYGVYELTKKGDYVSIGETESLFDEIKTFCYIKRNLSVSAFWASAQLRLYIETTDYQVYLAPNVSTINQMVQASETAWFYSQLPWRSKVFKIDPFQDICVGVMTSHNYNIDLSIKSVDYMMLLATVAGIAIYWLSPKLCRNTFFHYTTGISAGIVLSLVILTYLIQKRMKVNVLGWVGVAYSLSVYFITRTWFNIKEYLTDQYFHWVVGYILLAGILSFMIMYRMGPPENPRTLNLIQWTMQAAGLGVIFMSSYHQPASMLLVILLVTWTGIPDSWKAMARTQYRKRFNKPKVKLLTEEEYNTQAMVETRKALEELRAYATSPQCSPWKTVSRLVSPKRFAEFIEGSPHVSEEEVMQYSHWDEVSEDEDEDDRITDDEEDDHANSSFDSAH